MPQRHSPSRPHAAGVRASAARRVRAAASVCLALAVCFAAAAVEGTGWVQGGEVVVLRSFAPNASARIETGRAARPRLVAENLPHPGALTPDARAYVVWATAGTVLRLGVLRRHGRGAAALEFRHPAGLESYGVVVTAEANADAARPAGAPVFATRALEVSAAPAAPPRRPGPAAAARSPAVVTRDSSRATTDDRAATPGGAAAPVTAEAEERARICAGRGCSRADFAGEVRGALRNRRARTLLLVAARGAGARTRGTARVTTVNDSAYARLRLRRVPPPTRFGARRHILWAVTDEAGPIYLGSIPEAGLNDSQTFVRAEGIGDPRFRLLVTAEEIYPAARPAGRRVLLTYKGRRRRR